MPEMTAAPRVGFIGTGLIGTPMVERLVECGVHVTVWNRTPEKTASLVAAGARNASTARELAQSVDIVCLCLTNTAAVEDVVFGPLGIASVMSPTHLLIDFSSIAPDATKQMAHRLHESSSGHWMDAPVSGGLPAAKAGRLIIFAGGSADDLERARPVFDALSQRVTLMGGIGTGQLAKSCNQMIVGCNLVAIAEMLAYARAWGIDASRMPEALAGGFADSLPLKIFGPRMAGDIDTPRMGALATFRKDIDQVTRLAAEVGAQVPMARRAAELLREASESERIGIDADISRIIRMFEPT